MSSSLFMRKLRLYVHIIRYKLMDVFIGKKRKLYFEQQRLKGVDAIPIFIISFNRLSYLKNTVAWLERMNKRNIIIIDNASTYEPLLEYYDSIPYEVIRLPYNGGHKVFWTDGRFEKYRNDFYIVTDPDLEPVDECPEDFLEKFLTVLKKYPFVKKVGFSLKIDDIPRESVFADEAFKWEKQYYDVGLKKDNIFYAGIDTTFALYAPEHLSKNIDWYKGFRVGYPYQAKHLPWYKSDTELTKEDVFYSENKENGWWDSVRGEVTPD